MLLWQLQNYKTLLALLVGPWEMFQWCAVASVGVSLHSSEGDEHQRVVLNQEGKTRYVVGADGTSKCVHVGELLGEMMIIPGSSKC